MGREIASCGACGSTVRFRSIAQLLVRELFGRDCALRELPRARNIVGLGLSDAACYARALERCFDYTNTFFHREPKLDITQVPERLAHHHDFVIASDVFEHVLPPASRAFAGARRLLKADGVLVLTVPFSLEAETIEHFPELHEFTIRNGVLRNRTRDGRQQTFDELVFHGGDGSTLEMRLFSRAGLTRELHDAGFTRVRFAAEPCERFGIGWDHPWSIPIVARP